MSEVVTNGLRQYVQHARHRDQRGDARGGGEGATAPVLPERVAARLRELRSSGRSEMLSATLAALHEAGWPLRPLAEALGISKQAVQARVRRRRAAAGLRRQRRRVAVAAGRRVAAGGGVRAAAVPAAAGGHPAGLRPHLTVKIDYTLRASAHRVAADQGHSLTQVVEGILDRYLRHGMADRDAGAMSSDQAPREASRAASRSR